MEMLYTCTVCEFQEASIVSDFAAVNPPIMWIVIYDLNLTYYPLCSFHCMVQFVRSGKRHYYWRGDKRITSRRRVIRRNRNKTGAMIGGY